MKQRGKSMGIRDTSYQLHDSKTSLPAKKNIASQNKPLIRKKKKPIHPTRFNQLRFASLLDDLISIEMSNLRSKLSKDNWKFDY
jgi:hypothetical protein